MHRHLLRAVLLCQLACPIATAQTLVGGVYIMPPASAPDLAGDVVDAISLPRAR